ELQDDTNVGGNLTIAASKSLSLTGGNTASRPGSPTEGMLYYDTTTKQLLTYANAKWQADRTGATKVVAMGAPAGCTGTVPVASQNYDAADYVVTSCTSAQTTINAAIAALPAGGGTVYLMEGTYIIDGAITPGAKTRLVGAGPGTVITLKNGINASVNAITISSVNEVEVSNLSLAGNKANNSSGTQRGISIGTSGSATLAGTIMNNLTISNFRDTGIDMVTGKSTRITNSSIFSNNTGISFNGVTEMTISGNTISSNVNTGITVLGTLSTVTNNTLRANGTGVYMQSGQENSISSNVVVASTSTGISLSSSSNYNTITGNTVTGGATEGIFLSSSSHNTITSNVVEGNATTGIGVSFVSDNNIVSNNRVHNNGGSGGSHGIYVYWSASYNRIVDNAVTDTAGSGYAINVINFSGASTGNYVAGNTYSGTGATTINDAATGTIYGGQTNGSTNYMIQPAGTIELMKNTNVTGTLTVSGTTTLNGSLAANSTAVFKNAADSTNGFQIQSSDTTALLTGDTTNKKIVIRALDVTLNLTLNGHLVSGGTAPTIAAGAAACTIPTVSVVGTDTAGKITVGTQGTCASGTLVTVTFASAFAASPYVSLTPANAAAAALAPYVNNSTISTTSFEIVTAAATTSPSGYVWYYHVIQ
ncbi:MAG: right-handed parallel beta-helix repeat-containing protein, partial [Candidatus Saccharimonadales bacterium]